MGGLILKKIVSIMLVALMMLFTAAMVVCATENASQDAKEKTLSTAGHATEEVKEAVSVVSENKTAEASKTQPGFEGVFAIAGLLAVASLVLSKRV